MMINTQRIANKILEAYKNNDLTSLADWLRELGCTDIHQGKEEVILTGLTGMRVGFILGDPITLAVTTGFAIFGEFWVRICPDLLEEVNKAWKIKKVKK